MAKIHMAKEKKYCHRDEEHYYDALCGSYVVPPSNTLTTLKRSEVNCLKCLKEIKEQEY